MTSRKTLAVDCAVGFVIGTLAVATVALPAHDDAPTTDVIMLSGVEEPPVDLPLLTTTTTVAPTTTAPPTTSTTTKRAKAAAASTTSTWKVANKPYPEGRDALLTPPAEKPYPDGCIGRIMDRAEADRCWRGLVSRYEWRGGVGKAMNVLYCESRGKSNAINHKGTDKYGTPTGLFQVKKGSTDPETNVRQAAEMHKARGWQPWACA